MQICKLWFSIFRYNVKKSPDTTSFNLAVTQNDDVIKACASYTGSKVKTNMVVIEIELLSGFEPDTESLQELKNEKQIKKVEYNEKENTIALYFNEMPKDEFCHEFEVKEELKVKERKAAIAKIYDYYDQKDTVSTLYNLSTEE